MPQIVLPQDSYLFKVEHRTSKVAHADCKLLYRVFRFSISLTSQ